VRIQAFARMNFMYTVLSKRHLTWFVDQKLVTGWDDARFPTVRGVVRRGVDVNVLRQFMCSQGSSRRIVNMEWNKFWAENKKAIDKTAKRFMAIDQHQNVSLKITNGPTPQDNTFLTTPYLPKDPSFGSRVVRLCNQVLLEKVDTDGIQVGEEIVLMRWGVVKITKVEEGVLEGEYVPDGNIKAAKRKLTWMANVDTNISVTLTEFDNLISKGKLEEGESFKDFLNPNTIATSTVIGDASLKTLQQHEIIQLERRGYYRVDQPYVNNQDKPLVLFMIPDGKAKAMSGLEGKLAHR
jgi:glutamyl-tRNA synthetase